jgi:hypothetical protein
MLRASTAATPSASRLPSPPAASSAYQNGLLSARTELAVRSSTIVSPPFVRVA